MGGRGRLAASLLLLLLCGASMSRAQTDDDDGEGIPYACANCNDIAPRMQLMCQNAVSEDSVRTDGFLSGP